MKASSSSTRSAIQYFIPESHTVTRETENLIFSVDTRMGSRISQSNGHQQHSHRSSFAMNLYHSFRQSIERRRRMRNGHRIGHNKRNSMHRPVLRLQVKTETLQKHKKMAGNGLHLISKEKLETLARESGMYENIFPHNPQSYPRSNAYDYRHRHSTGRDSMVIVQFVDDGPAHLADGGRHDNGYDKLLPKGEFDHLCTLRYGRVNSHVSSSGEQFDSSDDHLTNINIGKEASQPSLVNDSMRMEQLHDRIIEHLEPYEPDPAFQRSNSMSALSSLRVSDFHSSFKKRHQSTGYLDADVGDWSLGESIMRTLSRGNVHLFDIENPQHESEKEVHRAWPNLKEKMARCRQSRTSLNNSDADSDKETFSDNEDSAPPLRRQSTTPSICLPTKSSEGHLV